MTALMERLVSRDPRMEPRDWLLATIDRMVRAYYRRVLLDVMYRVMIRVPYNRVLHAVEQVRT